MITITGQLFHDGRGAGAVKRPVGRGGRIGTASTGPWWIASGIGATAATAWTRLLACGGCGCGCGAGGGCCCGA
jgi:hypothetical protein